MTHITLPVIDGKPVQAKIKGPKNKVIRNYNRCLVKNTRLAMDSDQCASKLNELNEALKGNDREGKPLKFNVEDRETLQAQVDEQFGKIEEIHEAQMFLPYEQLLTIIELPEGVTADDIDWDEMDRDRTQEALDFFTASVSGKQS